MCGTAASFDVDPDCHSHDAISLKCPPAEFSDIHEASELAGKIRLRDSWKAMFTRPYRQVVETQGGEGRCVAEPEAAQQLEGSLELHGTKPAVEFVAGTELG